MIRKIKTSSVEGETEGQESAIIVYTISRKNQIQEIYWRESPKIFLHFYLFMGNTDEHTILFHLGTVEWIV